MEQYQTQWEVLYSQFTSLHTLKAGEKINKFYENDETEENDNGNIQRLLDTADTSHT